MADNIDYEYENEDSIDNNLKCGICNDPFIDPVVTPCHHSYCWLCLDRWFQTSKSTCPACRKTISRLNTIPVTLLSFLSMLDQLPVECKLCKQSKIQRGNFEDHIDKICPKKTVNCSASDINCPWTGLREELQTHLNTCIFESTRSLLEPNNNENQQKVEKPVKRRTLSYNSIFQVENISVDLVLMSVNSELEHVSEEDLMIAIREVLIHKQCTHLNLFGQKLSSEAILHIASALSNDMALKSLELGKCSMQDNGVEFLTKNLPVDSCLEYLDLYGNSITDTGVQYLAEMLKKNSRLSRLKLAQNRIGNEGVQILVDVLINHKSKLERLSLVGNTLISDACIYSIFSIIRYNQTLKILNLEGCNLSYYVQNLILLCKKIYFRTDLEIVL